MLEYSEKLGRKIRTDVPRDLGIATYHLVEENIATHPEAATEYFAYMRREFIIIYTFMVQWSGDLVGCIEDRWGPEAKRQVCGLTYPAYREHRPEQLDFLDSNQQAAADRVHTEFKKVTDKLNILDRELQNPQRRKLLSSIKDTEVIYTEAFNQLVGIIFEHFNIILEIISFGRVFFRIVESFKSTSYTMG